MTTSRRTFIAGLTGAGAATLLSAFTNGRGRPGPTTLRSSPRPIELGDSSALRDDELGGMRRHGKPLNSVGVLTPSPSPNSWAIASARTSAIALGSNLMARAMR